MSFPDPPVLLLQPGQFFCPWCGHANAVAQLVTAGALANPLAGFCNRCEHGYQLTVGAPSTTTTGSSNTQGAARRRGRGRDGLLGGQQHQHPYR